MSQGHQIMELNARSMYTVNIYRYKTIEANGNLLVCSWSDTGISISLYSFVPIDI